MCLCKRLQPQSPSYPRSVLKGTKNERAKRKAAQRKKDREIQNICPQPTKNSCATMKVTQKIGNILCILLGSLAKIVRKYNSEHPTQHLVFRKSLIFTWWVELPLFCFTMWLSGP